MCGFYGNELSDKHQEGLKNIELKQELNTAPTSDWVMDDCLESRRHYYICWILQTIFTQQTMAPRIRVGLAWSTVCGLVAKQVPAVITPWHMDGVNLNDSSFPQPG